MVDENTNITINRHNRYMRSHLFKRYRVPVSLPLLWWIPKIHMKLISKQCYIAIVQLYNEPYLGIPYSVFMVGSDKKQD